MDLTDLERRILRSAARAAGGLLMHFEAPPGGTPYLLVAGQRLDLEEGEAIPRLLRAGLLAPDMGRALRLTHSGQAAAEG